MHIYVTQTRIKPAREKPNDKDSPCDKCSLQEETALASVSAPSRIIDFYHSSTSNTNYSPQLKQNFGTPKQYTSIKRVVNMKSETMSTSVALRQ